MAEEIELKLAIAEADQRRLLAHPLLRDSKSVTRELVNIYYDTPNRALFRRGIALRLRRQGNDWLQTVKCASEVGGGLSTRPEWEQPYTGRFDFSTVDAPEVGQWLDRPGVRRRLMPAFETSFRRRIWRLEPEPGCVVLVMLDRGWIAAAGRREAISEVELELASGHVGHLFDVAESLANRVALIPAEASKAARGYRLATGAVEAPIKAREIPLGEEQAPLEAFRRVALGCLSHLQQNHHGVVSSDDPEYIHQMRVATRRLRAALRLFRPVLPETLEPRLLPTVRELADLLGRARDLDVLFEEIVAPVVAAMPKEPRLAALAGAVTERRHAARQSALHALRDTAHSRMLLHTLRLLHEMPTSASITVTTLPLLAEKRLHKARKRALLFAREANVDQPASLHALRIAVKRLRYGLDFFAPLLVARARARVVNQLSETQDRLGQLNDLANAGELLSDCAGSDPALREAVSLVGGWHGRHHAELLAGVPAQVAALTRMRLPRLRIRKPHGDKD